MSEPNSQMPETAATISIAHRIVASDAFKQLFRDGMTLVEDTAAYLDGPGRQESRLLARAGALAYASESMRLTTRLMQMTSWLLLQRAVNEGELTREEAEREHRKVKISPEASRSAADSDPLLPEPLRLLMDRAERLQNRVLRLDQQLRLDAAPGPDVNPVADQLGALRAALGLQQA